MYTHQVEMIIAAAAMGMLFALGMSNNAFAAVVNVRFWRSLLRSEGLVFIVLTILLIAIEVTVNALWTMETTPRSFYLIWRRVDIPLHLGYILSGLILGTLIGGHYRRSQDNQSIDSDVNTERREKWLPTASAVIGSIPFFLSMTIVLAVAFYRHNGLFYTWLDRTHINSVEWASEEVINFRVVSYQISDYVGGGAIPYCDYEANISLGNARQITCGELETWNSDTEIAPVPSASEPLLSPKKTHAVYVVRDYDLYIKSMNSDIFSSRRVYRYPSSGFFGRYYQELGMLLIYALPVGVGLMVFWAYDQRSHHYVRRIVVAMAIWNISFFIGSLFLERWELLSLHKYLWASIP